MERHMQILTNSIEPILMDEPWNHALAGCLLKLQHIDKENGDLVAPVCDTLLKSLIEDPEDVARAAHVAIQINASLSQYNMTATVLEVSLALAVACIKASQSVEEYRTICDLIYYLYSAKSLYIQANEKSPFSLN